MTALVTGETTIAATDALMRRRGVTSLRVYIADVGCHVDADIGSRGHGHSVTGLTLAEALSALLSEIPIVGGDHGQ